MCVPISSEAKKPVDAGSSGSSLEHRSRPGEPLGFACLGPGAWVKGGALSTALLTSLPGLCLCMNWGLCISSYKPPTLTCLRHVWNCPTVWDTNQNTRQGTLRGSQCR